MKTYIIALLLPMSVFSQDNNQIPFDVWHKQHPEHLVLSQSTLQALPEEIQLVISNNYSLIEEIDVTATTKQVDVANNSETKKILKSVYPNQEILTQEEFDLLETEKQNLLIQQGAVILD